MNVVTYSWRFGVYGVFVGGRGRAGSFRCSIGGACYAGWTICWLLATTRELVSVMKLFLSRLVSVGLVQTARGECIPVWYCCTCCNADLGVELCGTDWSLFG